MATDSLIRIGAVGCEGEDSHIQWQWTPLMNPPPGFGRRTGMKVTHVWDKNRSTAEKYAATYGIPNIVDRYDDMIGKVDGVIQGIYPPSYWQLELLAPYIKAGVPVHADRPGGFSVARIEKMMNLAAKHNTPIMVTNNHESTRMVQLLKSRADLLGPLQAVVADSIGDRQARLFSWHCIHGFFMLYPVLAGKVRRVRAYAPQAQQFVPVVVFECENRDGSKFNATLVCKSLPHRSYAKLFGHNAVFDATLLPPTTYRTGGILPASALVSGSPEWTEYLLTDFSLPVMRNFEKMIITGKMWQTHEQIIEKVTIFLAAFRSLLSDGLPIEMNRMEKDWTAPNPYPDYFPSDYFPLV